MLTNGNKKEPSGVLDSGGLPPLEIILHHHSYQCISFGRVYILLYNTEKYTLIVDR